MARELTNHDEIIAAIRRVESISDLIAQAGGQFKHELDLDVIVFGRNYGGKKVGPYARLFVYEPGEVIVEQNSWSANTFYILIDGRLEVTIEDENGVHLVGEILPGQSFGEMAVLSGTRRIATVRVAQESQANVLDLARPALRLLRKLPKFGAALDKTYRNSGLTYTLREVQGFAPALFNPEVLKRFGDATRFVVYEKNHVLFQEGDPINRFVYVKNGWIRRVSGADFNPAVADLLMGLDEEVSVDFLGAGSCLGFEGIERPGKWQNTATVMTRAEVIEVAISRLRSDPELRHAVVGALSGVSQVDDKPKPVAAVDKRQTAAASKEINTGIVDGVNLLVMDMDLCVRCGNCSLACHKVHGHSRLIRRGIHIERPVKPQSLSVQSVLAPSVCLHCQDAECLTGCPTGAIARFPEGQVDIDPGTCIGCGDCATQCPYNAISMIPRKAEKAKQAIWPARFLKSLWSLAPQSLPEPVTAMDDLLAVKCNLCDNTGMNPRGAKRQAYSCEENCPTGALVRVNPREYFTEVRNTMGLVYQDKTHAIGRNIHKSDPLATAWHVFGIFFSLIVGGLAFWATRRYSPDGSLGYGWLTMRWVTGLVGLLGILWAMAYPIRKQIYRRRAGALRYWMLSHVYLGVLAGFVLLVHGWNDSGGLLTSLLMLSFDLVILTGIFGALCYLFVPRMLTRIEGEPLLLEDLNARREELRERLAEISTDNPDSELRKLIRTKLRDRFLSFPYLARQYFKREDLQSMLAKARAAFSPEVEALTASGGSSDDGSLLLDAVETMATLRRVDALIYLHQLLKIWLAPHVVFTAIMLVLLVAHIIQAIYFGPS